MSQRRRCLNGSRLEKQRGTRDYKRSGLTEMELVLDNQYQPQYNDYKGAAVSTSAAFATFRTSVPSIDGFLAWLAGEVLEFNVANQGGTMLEMRVWKEESSYGGLPTYNWIIEIWYYFVPQPATTPKVVPQAAWVVIQLIAAAVLTVAIYFALGQVKELVWGVGTKPGEVSPVSWAILVAALGFTFTPIVIAYMGGKGKRSYED